MLHVITSCTSSEPLPFLSAGDDDVIWVRDCSPSPYARLRVLRTGQWSNALTPLSGSDHSSSYGWFMKGAQLKVEPSMVFASISKKPIFFSVVGNSNMAITLHDMIMFEIRDHVPTRFPHKIEVQASVTWEMWYLLVIWLPPSIFEKILKKACVYEVKTF